MTRKKKKPVSFDAMVKFFMQHYEIPTKKDIERLTLKIDQLEGLLRGMGATAPKGRPTRRKAVTAKSVKGQTAANAVFEVIESSKDGVGFAEIKERTGFEDKKLRNIIFRLHSTAKISRKSRGVYVAA